MKINLHKWFLRHYGILPGNLRQRSEIFDDIGKAERALELLHEELLHHERIISAYAAAVGVKRLLQKSTKK